MTYEPRPRPRMARDVLADQQRQTARDRAERQQNAARPAAPSTPAMAVVPEAKAPLPAVPDTRTPVQQYLDDVAPVSLVGRMIKFSKDGQFVTADDGEPIPDTADFVVLADQTLVGYVKFNGEGEPPDRVMGLLYDGFVMPSRETLGDLDQTEWQLGLDGRPADPWQHHQCLVLQRGDTAELFTFVTSSVTGRRAVGNLLRHYDRQRRMHPDTYPVVRLKTGGFNHRDERVGWVSVPVFQIVGRHSADDVSKPDSSLKADLNDALPFDL